MRSNRLWIGVTCGVALALGVVAAVGAGTQANGEPAEGQQATDFTEQLEHNQNIASEATKRSNRSLNYLAPIRTTQSDDADDGSGGVRAGSGGGWTVGQLARGQKQLWASLRPDAAKVDQTIAQSGPASGTPGSITSTREGDGNYVVELQDRRLGLLVERHPLLPRRRRPVSPHRRHRPRGGPAEQGQDRGVPRHGRPRAQARRQQRLRTGALLIRSAVATAPAGPPPRPGSGQRGARAVEQLREECDRGIVSPADPAPAGCLTAAAPSTADPPPHGRTGCRAPAFVRQPATLQGPGVWGRVFLQRLQPWRARGTVARFHQLSPLRHPVGLAPARGGAEGSLRAR